MNTWSKNKNKNKKIHFLAPIIMPLTFSFDLLSDSSHKRDYPVSIQCETRRVGRTIAEENNLLGPRWKNSLLDIRTTHRCMTNNWRNRCQTCTCFRKFCGTRNFSNDSAAWARLLHHILDARHIYNSRCILLWIVFSVSSRVQCNRNTDVANICLREIFFMKYYFNNRCVIQGFI